MVGNELMKKDRWFLKDGTCILPTAATANAATIQVKLLQLYPLCVIS